MKDLIEGDTLERNQVRSSIARRLGMDVDGIVHADRDILDLIKRGELKKDPGCGRSTSYSLLIE